MAGLHESEDISVSRVCALLGKTKQAYYERLHTFSKERTNDEIILQIVCEIRKEMPVAGTRKLYYELQNRMESVYAPGRDYLFNLLRYYGLLIRKSKRRVRTTMSFHQFHTYPNLYNNSLQKEANRVWVSDITYIRLCNGDFLYLSLITDAYSHMIVGWNLSESLGLDGALNAVKKAIGKLDHPELLIHHSDRGIQYCSHAYTRFLKEKGVRISMTQSGNPRDNAIAERVNGILKHEWLDHYTMSTFQQALQQVSSAINLYNTKRRHQSLNYMTPVQAAQFIGPIQRRWKSYYRTKTIITDEKVVPNEFTNKNNRIFEAQSKRFSKETQSIRQVDSENFASKLDVVNPNITLPTNDNL